MTDPRARAAGLACWKGPVDPEPLGGGITNTNFVVREGGEAFVVRIGGDLPVHGILRVHEVAAARAAHAAGLAPEVVHWEPGALVMRHVEGRTLTAADVRAPATLERILPLVRRCHQEVPRHLRGPAPMFWVFHVVRDYAATLREGGSRLAGALPRLLDAAAALEAAVGPVRIVFGHNDLLAANFLDDGARIWLLDWEYAGFNSALFDLGGLASNSELAPEAEAWLVEAYFERPLTAERWRAYAAMKCASLLREAMWSLVSELHSCLAFDYRAYTEENLGRFERAYAAFHATR